MVHSILLHLPENATEVNRRTAAILSKQIERRCGVPVSAEGKAEFIIELQIDRSLPPEAFRVEDAPDGVLITGGSDRGVLYGVGKFLHCASYGEGSFEPGAFRGMSSPSKPVRGIYFATHFGNYYNAASYEELAEYIESLALWGYNAVTVWFDMHHYRSMADPAALEMIDRLHFILASAREIGLDTGLLVLANEGFAESPEALRADWTAGHGGYFMEPCGHYHVELCPNKPGGLELLLDWRGQVFEAFSDVRLDTVWIWPYDQGGCTCADCAPWGARGYLQTARPIARLARELFPQAKIILSTWEFDKFVHGEFAAFAQSFDNSDGWVDYLMAENPRIAQGAPSRECAYLQDHEVPGGLPLLGFPEISMYSCAPWGGYGGNPLPGYLQSLWNQQGDKMAGGFPYSEGIFEDINKVICAYFYWHGSGNALDGVREYLSYEVSPEDAETLLHVIELFERGNRRHRSMEDGTVLRNPQFLDQQRYLGRERFVIEDPSGVDEAYSTLQALDDRLPNTVRNSWRWRIIYLRSVIDWELLHHNMQPNPRCEDAFEEVIRLFHVENSIWSVKPPSRRHPAKIEQG